jgi:hypothetical protein
MPEDIVLEPSFGGCTILEAALNRLKYLGCTAPADGMIGFDVDQSAFLHLRQLLGRKSVGHFSSKDFLSIDGSGFRVDTVIGNPPFVAYHRMDSNQRAAIRGWRAQHHPRFPMTASLWAYFVVHAMSFLKQNGRMAFVLPSAVTSSDYSQPIIRTLAERFAKLTLYKVNEQLFIQAGAEERTVILLADGYRIGESLDGVYTERSIGGIKELADALRESTLGKISVNSLAARSVVKPPADSLLRRAISSGDLCEVGSVATIRIGEVTGDTDYFVKPLDSWQELGIGQRHLRPIVTRSRQFAGLGITAKEVSALYSAIPRMLSPASTRIPKRLQNYLDGYSKKRRLLNKTFIKRNPWYAVSYDASATAFIASMSHESPRIVLNRAGVSCGNGLYKISSKTAANSLDWLAVASLTSVFRLSAEMHARIRGSGALKLEPSDVARLLVPSPTLMRQLSLPNKLKRRLDELIRLKEFESATREADTAIFTASGLFSTSELQTIRDRLQDLRGERLPQKHYAG